MPRARWRGTPAARRSRRAPRSGSRRGRTPARRRRRLRQARPRVRRTRRPSAPSRRRLRWSARASRTRRSPRRRRRVMRSSRRGPGLRAARGSAHRRAGTPRTGRRRRSPRRRAVPQRSFGPRSASRSAGRVEIERQWLGALLTALVRGLHGDLLAALALLEGAAYVEAELELRRRVEEGLGRRQAEHAHEVVVQTVEAVTVLVRPHDVGVGRRRDPLAGRGRYRALFFAEIERMNDSMGIAVSDSIDRVPRAPRLTDTRAIVSASFASTTFTKS